MSTYKNQLKKQRSNVKVIQIVVREIIIEPLEVTIIDEDSIG